MNRFILAIRCFFAVLFYYRLPPAALALLPPPDLGRLPEPEEPAPAGEKPAEAARQAGPPAGKEPVKAPAKELIQAPPAREPATREPPVKETVPAPPAKEPPVKETVPAPVKEPPAKEPPVKEPPAKEPAAKEPAQSAEEARRGGAIQMLAILQREGRLIDFLMEDVDAYADAQIGAAVRDIHRGCRKGLKEHFQIAAIRPEPDEAAVRVEEGYDPARVRLIGNIAGRPPFHGTLRHHGWRASSVLLPALPQSHDPLVIAPAEVELDG